MNFSKIKPLRNINYMFVSIFRQIGTAYFYKNNMCARYLLVYSNQFSQTGFTNDLSK